MGMQLNRIINSMFLSIRLDPGGAQTPLPRLWRAPHLTQQKYQIKYAKSPRPPIITILFIYKCSLNVLFTKINDCLKVRIFTNSTRFNFFITFFILTHLFKYLYLKSVLIALIPSLNFIFFPSL